jgi:hypothetical protein
MDFDDEIRAAIHEGKSAADWNTLRESLIFPAFETASADLEGQIEVGFGGSYIVLYAPRDKGGNAEYSLAFEVDREARVIVCSCEPFAPAEQLTLDQVNPEYLKSKVVYFARAVAVNQVRSPE